MPIGPNILIKPMNNSDLQPKIKLLVKNFICGFCQAQLGYSIQFAARSETYDDYGDFVSGNAYSIISCNHCNRLSILLFDVFVDDCGPSFDNHVSADLYAATDPEILNCWWDKDEPFTIITTLKYKGQLPSGHKFNTNIPESISNLIRQATNCLTIGSPDASVVMCRRILEQLVKHIGIRYKPKSELLESLLKDGHINQLAYTELSKEPTLHQNIEQAKTEGRIDEKLYKALTETRSWGNLGAHANDNSTLTHSDGIEIIKLTAQIVEYIYSTERLTTITDELSQRRARIKAK